VAGMDAGGAAHGDGAAGARAHEAMTTTRKLHPFDA
jgi:hypothetical protein